MTRELLKKELEKALERGEPVRGLIEKRMAYFGQVAQNAKEELEESTAELARLHTQLQEVELEPQDPEPLVCPETGEECGYLCAMDCEREAV